MSRKPLARDEHEAENACERDVALVYVSRLVAAAPSLTSRRPRQPRSTTDDDDDDDDCRSPIAREIHHSRIHSSLSPKESFIHCHLIIDRCRLTARSIDVDPLDRSMSVNRSIDRCRLTARSIDVDPLDRSMSVNRSIDRCRPARSIDVG